MKKLLILSIGLLLFAGCDKEETSSNCSVCTVVTSNPSTGEETTTHSQFDYDQCEMSQVEYMEEVELTAELNDQMDEITASISGQFIDVTHTVSCVYE